MGAAIVNDDGAISIIPFGAPAMKETPVTVGMIVITLGIFDFTTIPMVVTLLRIVTDVSPVHP